MQEIFHKSLVFQLETDKHITLFQGVRTIFSRKSKHPEVHSGSVSSRHTHFREEKLITSDTGTFVKLSTAHKK